MKYYYAFFRDNNTSVDPDGHLYKVVVKTKKGNGMEELLLSGSPFTVMYENGDIYKPYKCSTATIGLLNTDYNPDFICDSIMDNEVYLLRLKNGEGYSDNLKLESADSIYFDIEWCGYTTPNAYSQGYNSYLDEFQLECQDKLSVLKYYRFDDVSKVQGTYLSVQQYLNSTAFFLGIKDVYVTKSLLVPNTEKNDAIYNWCENVHVLKSSFTSDDGYMYCSDILSDLMLYFSLTAIQDKGALYVINYNAITNGFVDYTHFDLKAGDIRIKRDEREYEINKDDSASNDTNLSILESYDDFVVTTDLDVIDRSMPSIEWYNKTPSEFVDEQYASCNGRIVTSDGVTQLMCVANWDDYTIYQQSTTRQTYGYTSLQFYSYNERKSYYTPELKFYAYEQDVRVSKNEFIRGDVASYIAPGQVQLVDMTYSKSIRDHVLSAPMSYALLSNEDWNKQLDKKHEDGIFICHPVMNVSAMSDTEWYNLITDHFNVVQQPMLDVVYQDVSLTKEHPLCWKVSVEYFPDYIPNLYEVKSKIQHPMDWMYMSISLKTGNATLYYDDVNECWNERFTLISPHLEGIEYDGDMYGSKHEFNNNHGNRFKVREYDHGIVISSFDKDYMGTLQIRLYRPFGPDYAFSHITTSTFLSGMDLVELDSRERRNIVSDSVMYEYKDKGRFINERIEETLKYSSFTGKANVINQVYCTNGEEIERLDYILDIPAGDVFRAEEQRLRDYVKQLSAPAFQLESTGHCGVDMITHVRYRRFPKSDFIVNGLTIDYVSDKRTYTIIEKR